MAEPDPYPAKVRRAGPTALTGFVYDRQDLAARLVVELLIDGVPVAVARADTYVDELAAVGDGRYGFAFVLTPAMLAGRRAQVVLANRGTVIAPPVVLSGFAAPRRGGEGGGRVEWVGGLHLTGWLAPDDDPARRRVRVSVGGEVVAQAPADRWHHLPEEGGARAAPAFSLHLPPRFADGRTQQVVVTDGLGTPLHGSPVSLVAFPDPLETLAAGAFGAEAGETAKRAKLFETLLPRSRPLTEWRAWVDAYPLPEAPSNTRPVAVLLVGHDRAEGKRTLDTLEGKAGCPWIAGILPSPDRIGFRASDLLGFLEKHARDCETVLVVPAGARLQPGVPARFAEALLPDSDVLLAYADVALGPDGRQTPLAFPAFDYERWLEQGYGAFCFGLPARRAAAAARQGADSVFRLANAQFDALADARSRVVHLPGIAALLPPLDRAASAHLAAATRRHLAARDMPAEVDEVAGTARSSLLPAARVRRAPPAGRISVIVPTRDRADLLGPCLTSIRRDLDRLGAELVVVDNDSSDRETRALLAKVRKEKARVLTERGPFNYARLMNRAVAATDGAFVCFLNNDVEAMRPGWLEELAGRLAEPGTAAAGAVLTWPTGVVQHGGIVLGPRFEASHAFCDRMAADPGYGGLLQVASEPSAVTAACLLVRREAFLAVGGFDETLFPVNFNDVDLCLKLGAAGHAVVLTPHLGLQHRASASRGPDHRPDQVARFQRELAALRAKWGERLLADPAYSPLLALSEIPYTALACPPRSFAPRRRITIEANPLPSSL